MTKKKKKKPTKKAAGKSPAQKAADTMRKRRLDAAAKEAAVGAIFSDKKPDVERSNVKITVYPRTSDNKEFENILDGNLGEEKEPASKPEAATPKPPESKPARPVVLQMYDVAEWVAWPFMLWAQVNNLPGLALSRKEARSVAEPLTSILNRHGVAGVLPPDVVDGLLLSARLSPIIGDRVMGIKQERARRAAGGTVTPPTRPAPGPGRMEYRQGAQATKPKEV